MAPTLRPCVMQGLRAVRQMTIRPRAEERDGETECEPSV
jgi:hypothetical protein